MGIAKFAINPDVTVGGKTKDTVTIPVPATSAKTWPLQRFSYDDGETPIELNDEFGYGRSMSADFSFQMAPSVTAGGVLYGPQAKSLMYQALGSANTTGTTLLGYSNALTAVADSTFVLPASSIHFQMEDEATPRVLVGAMLDQVEMTWGETFASWTATWRGNYLVEGSATAIPALDYSYLGSSKWPIAGRDGAIYEAGSGTASGQVSGFSVKIGPLFDARDNDDYDWSTNIEDRVLDSATSRLWFPNSNRLAGKRNITGTVKFRGLDATKTQRAVMRRTRQMRADFTTARTIAGTSPALKELLRFDIPAAEWTSVERDEITSDQQINATYGWKATYPSTGADFTCTVLDALPGPVSVVN